MKVRIDKIRNRVIPKSIALLLASVFLVGITFAQSAENASGESVITEAVSFSNGDVVLSGLLTKPLSGLAFPAAILLSGSGPQDRNGDTGAIPEYGPFTTIAEHLARNGFAVLRYDDRGYGESTPDYGSSTEEDFIADAAAGLAFLRERNDIIGERVGFIGHSEGSLIAASVARTNPNAAFVISLAGGAYKGFDLLLDQAELQARAVGMSEDAVAEVIQRQSNILNLAMEQDWEGLTSVIKETLLTRIEALTDEQKAAMGDLDEFVSLRAARSVGVFQHPSLDSHAG